MGALNCNHTRVTMGYKLPLLTRAALLSVLFSYPAIAGWQEFYINKLIYDIASICEHECGEESPWSGKGNCRLDEQLLRAGRGICSCDCGIVPPGQKKPPKPGAPQPNQLKG